MRKLKLTVNTKLVKFENKLLDKQTLENLIVDY